MGILILPPLIQGRRKQEETGEQKPMMLSVQCLFCFPGRDLEDCFPLCPCVRHLSLSKP